MFDRTLVSSGFDIEMLISEDYLTYLLLAQIEAGLLPLHANFVNESNDHNIEIKIHPPDYKPVYDQHPDAVLPESRDNSLNVRLQPEEDEEFLFLLVWVTITDKTENRKIGEAPAGTYFNLELEYESPPDLDLESRHRIKLTFVRFQQSIANILEQSGVDVSAVEEIVRDTISFDIPLGVTQGQQVHQIRLRKFLSDTQRSLGIFINLALKSTPNEYVEVRGNIADAQDFRPASAPMAFATSPRLFAMLGPDMMARMAEPNNSDDGWKYPLREDISNSESKEIGHIKDIKVGPEIIVGGPGKPNVITGRLMINLHGEYTDAPGDPDFHLQLFFKPIVDADGIVSWDVDVDIDFGLLATLLMVAAGIGLTLIFGPGLGWGSTLIVGSILGVAVLKGLIAEPLAAKIISDRLDVETQVGLLDVLPLKVPGASRRWDPFYMTEHIVIGLVDENVIIDEGGIAIVAAHLQLDRQFIPINHVVIRDEERINESVSALRYRVSDFTRIAAELRAIAPGTDRLDYTRSNPLGEPEIVSLTLDQLVERITLKKILAPLTYFAKRIYLVDGQIEQILALSSREQAEQNDAVIRNFRTRMREFLTAEFGDSIRAEVTQELMDELGTDPTPEQVTKAFDNHLNKIIDGLMRDFKRQLLPGLLDAAIARTLRFDLRPEEMIHLQRVGVLVLDGVEIIERHNADGQITPYYRDPPDGDPRDNLLSLRHYSYPYVPPTS